MRLLFAWLDESPLRAGTAIGMALLGVGVGLRLLSGPAPSFASDPLDAIGVWVMTVGLISALVTLFVPALLLIWDALLVSVWRLIAR